MKIVSHRRQIFLVTRENYWFGVLHREYFKLSPMSSSIPFTTQSNAGVSKCFKWRKREANKTYWWVISGKRLQSKCQKRNFIGEDCKAKCAKTWKLVHNVKSMTTSTFECKSVLRIGFIVEAYCSMFSVGLIHCNSHDEMFRYKK